MVEIDKEALEELTPEERIKKLKELEEEKKKEIDEAETLIQETIAEIENDERLKLLDVPDSPEVDIAELFGAKGDDLESTVEAEHPASTSTSGDGEYVAKRDEDWNSYIPGEENSGGKVEDIGATQLETASQSQYLSEVHVGSKQVKYQSDKHQKG